MKTVHTILAFVVGVYIGYLLIQFGLLLSATIRLVTALTNILTTGAKR